MPTTALVQRRTWLRLPVSISAAFISRIAKQRFNGNILNLSENGLGFTLEANIQYLDEITIEFWLPYDGAHPNDAMLEPIVTPLTLVSSRYSAHHGVYAYGAVFLGLRAEIRKLIRAYVQRVATAA